MSPEELNTADPAEESETVEVDPLEAAIGRLTDQMEAGDFKKVRTFLDDQIRQADPEVASGLEHQRVRLRLDPVAIAVMAICGGLLGVVLAITLFH